MRVLSDEGCTRQRSMLHVGLQFHCVFLTTQPVALEVW